MLEKIKQGNLVYSLSGRDKGEIFLVVRCDDKYAYIANGKIRKVQSLKKKNLAHLKKVNSAKLLSFAERIEKGMPVGNYKLYRAIKTQKEKIQED